MPVSIRLYRRLPLTYFLGFWSLIILLVLRSGPAYAEWSLLAEFESGKILYVDPDTIRRKGDLVKMWHMYDYKKAQMYRGNSFLSIKTQRQYDCAEEQSRSFSEIGLTGNMGTGEVAYSFQNQGSWTPIVPETSGQLLWVYVCEKK